MNVTERVLSGKIRVCVCVAATALLGPASISAQVESSRVTKALEQIRQETRAPGIAVAVSVNGATVFSGGVGYAELDNLTPADGGTVLNVGSVVSVEVESGAVHGRFPGRAARHVLEWAALHREELLSNGDLARQHKPLKRIAPLE